LRETLPREVANMSKKTGEHDSTKIIGQRELNVGGVPFQWWAVGDRPTLVTVRSSVFGSLNQFTDEDPADYAITLAKRLLKEHYDRAAATQRTTQEPSDGGSVLKKPGWFDEADNVDFTKTYV
jgi:hypothetical protein